MKIPVIVLAAGAASRFGRSKLLEDLDGRPVIHHALLAARAAAVGPVVLVTGHDAAAIESASARLVDEFVFNAAHANGMGTSIACGVDACRDGEDAVLLLLGDQPRVTDQHLRQLVDTWSGAADEIVATSYAGTQGPPVLFGSAAFDALSVLEGDRGARHLIKDKRFHVRAVACEAAGIDIDTEADLETVRRN